LSSGKCEQNDDVVLWCKEIFLQTPGKGILSDVCCQDYSLISFARDPGGVIRQKKKPVTGLALFRFLPLVVREDYSLISFARDPGGGIRQKKKPVTRFARVRLCFFPLLLKASFQRFGKKQSLSLSADRLFLLSG